MTDLALRLSTAIGYLNHSFPPRRKRAAGWGFGWPRESPISMAGESASAPGLPKDLPGLAWSLPCQQEEHSQEQRNEARPAPPERSPPLVPPILSLGVGRCSWRGHHCRAKRATSSGNGNFAQAFRAFLAGRIGRNRVARRAGFPGIHWRDHKEVNRRRYQQ